MSFEPRDYLEGSFVIAWVRRRYAQLSLIARRVSRPVIGGMWMRKCIRTLNVSPLRACGLILVASVLTNAAFLWVLGKEGSALGNILRVVVLVLGFVGLSHSSDWATIRQGSWAIRTLERILPVCPKGSSSKQT